MPSNTGPEKKTPFYTLGEEITNSITHGVGAGMAIAGMVVLLVQSNDVWQVVSSAIYGASMIFLFLMSCLYHALTNPTAKRYSASLTIPLFSSLSPGPIPLLPWSLSGAGWAGRCSAWSGAWLSSGLS